MPKNIRPKNGYTIEEVFENLPDILKQIYQIKPIDPELDCVIDSIRKSINPDVCCTPDQRGLVEKRISTLCETKSDSELSESEAREKLNQKVDTLIALINSFRLGCSDCLNHSCTKRDPNCLAEEVWARGKQFDEAEKTEK